MLSRYILALYEYRATSTQKKIGGGARNNTKGKVIIASKDKGKKILIEHTKKLGAIRTKDGGLHARRSVLGRRRSKYNTVVCS